MNLLTQGRCALFLATLGALAAPALADVVYVDPSGIKGPPGLQAAVDAAADGDTILVFPSDHPAAHLDGAVFRDAKSLTVITPRGHEARIGTIHVRDVPQGHRILFKGVDMVSLRVENVGAAVLVDDCAIESLPSQTAVTVLDSRDIVFTDSTIAGFDSPLLSGPPGMGLHIFNSRVALFGSQVTGGAASVTLFGFGSETGRPGMTGCQAFGRSFLWVGASTIRGGDGGDVDCTYACTAVGGPGGDGLQVDPAARVVVSDSSISGGIGGSGAGSEGLLGADVVGAIEEVPGPHRTLEAPLTIESGRAVTVTADGLPGETIELYIARGGGLRNLGPFVGVWAQSNFLPGMPVVLGTIPASGSITAQYLLPLAAGADVQTYSMQVIARTSPTRMRTSTVETVSVLGPELPNLHGPARIYVNQAAAPGGDGRSWATAFQHLGTALRWLTPFAQPGGIATEIWLAQGTYRPTEPGGPIEAAFPFRPGVRILGGFQGNESAASARDPRLHPTILSADLNGDDTPGANRSDNSVRLLRASVISSGSPMGAVEAFEVDGITLTACAGEAAIQGLRYGKAPSDLTVRNCRITDNHANSTFGFYARAGAIEFGYESDHGSLTLLDSKIIGNTGGFSAGVYAELGSSTPSLIAGNVFAGNVAYFSGFNGGRSGALYCFGIGAGGLDVLNNTFWANGVVTNTSSLSGTAVSIHAGYNRHTFRSNIVAGSRWNDSYSVPGYNQHNASVYDDASYNVMDWIPTNWTGVHNVVAAPGFVDGFGPDGVRGTLDDVLTLGPGSAAIDAGDSTALSPWMTLDVDGRPRRVDDPSVVDTGLGGAPALDAGATERQ